MGTIATEEAKLLPVLEDLLRVRTMRNMADSESIRWASAQRISRATGVCYPKDQDKWQPNVAPLWAALIMEAVTILLRDEPLAVQYVTAQSAFGATSVESIGYQAVGWMGSKYDKDSGLWLINKANLGNPPKDGGVGMGQITVRRWPAVMGRAGELGLGLPLLGHGGMLHLGYCALVVVSEWAYAVKQLLNHAWDLARFTLYWPGQGNVPAPSSIFKGADVFTSTPVKLELSGSYYLKAATRKAYAIFFPKTYHEARGVNSSFVDAYSYWMEHSALEADQPRLIMEQASRLIAGSGGSVSDVI